MHRSLMHRQLSSYCGRRFIGVYEDMKDAIAAAEAGYRAIREMRVEEREKLITAIRTLCREEAPSWQSSALPRPRWVG